MKKKYCFLFLFICLQIQAQCWRTVSPGTMHTVAVKTDGTLWTWGFNGYGQLGDNTAVDKHIPTQIGTDHDWVSAKAGSHYCLAQKSDGSLWAWGMNFYGQCGIPSNPGNILIPTRIGTATDWQFYTAASQHTIAIKNNGTLWIWGYNDHGMLGTGTTGSVMTPTQIGTDTDWKSATGGNSHTIALKTNGTIWTWGFNSVGQLGNGSYFDSNYTPTQVGTDNDWKLLGDGINNAFNVVIKNDGSMWSFGGNSYGNLGTGLATSSPEPIRIGTENNWDAVSLGAYSAFAHKTDGSMWSWGYNEYSSLGIGTNTNVNVPTRIGTDNDWMTFDSGSGHTMALKTNGVLWTWGSNSAGYLGNDTTTPSNFPIQINCVPLATVAFNADSNIFSIAPNPVKEKLVLLSDRDFSIDKIIIADLSGKKVMEHYTGLKEIDVAPLEKGIYLLEIFSGGAAYRKKFIKE